MKVWHCFAAFWIFLDTVSYQAEGIHYGYYSRRYPACGEGCRRNRLCWRWVYQGGRRVIHIQRHEPEYASNGCCPGYCGLNCNVESFSRLSYYVKKNQFKIDRLEKRLTGGTNMGYIHVLNGNNRHPICPSGPKGDRGIMGPKGSKGEQGLPGLPGEQRTISVTTDASSKNEYEKKLQALEESLTNVRQETMALSTGVSQIRQNLSNLEIQESEKMHRALEKEKELSDEHENVQKRLSSLNNTVHELMNTQYETKGQIFTIENDLKNIIQSNNNDELFREMKNNISSVFDQISNNNETLQTVISQLNNLSDTDINSTIAHFNKTTTMLRQMILNGFDTMQSLLSENEQMSRTVDTLNKKNELFNQTTSELDLAGIANGDNIALLQTANMALLDEINVLKNKNNELNNTVRDLMEMFLKTNEELTNSVSGCRKNITHLMSACGTSLKEDEVKPKDNEMDELLSKYNKLSLEYEQLNLLIQMYNESRMSSGTSPIDDTEDEMGDMSILPTVRNTTEKQESECYCLCCANGKPFTKPFPKPPPLRPGFKPIPEEVGDLAGLCSSILEHSAEKRSTIGKDDKERKLNDYLYLYDDYLADNAQAEALKVPENVKLGSMSTKLSAYGVSVHMLSMYITFVCVL